MKFIFTTFLLLICLNCYSQNSLSLSEDSLFFENTPVARLKESSFGLKVTNLEGKVLITISEGGYHFGNGKSAWPQKAVFSKEVTLSVLNSNNLFSKGGLNATSVERFVRRYPVKQSILLTLRNSPKSMEDE